MLAGTGSDVGKSILATAFCRIFKQDGYTPAPFKAQNMALNSFATPDGLEIGRAQAVQAEAAGVPCHTDMNPLLLKPSSDHTAQVILDGRPIGTKRAFEYFKMEGRDVLREGVQNAFSRLQSKYHPIVMEGAGSIAEINLRSTDLVNMSMAAYADAAVVLVADIDRGGVFASAYGSIALQSPQDRERIKGIIVNKFRGDMRLFDEGRRMMEQLCGVPVLGVVPYYHDIYIEEEDSLELSTKRWQSATGKINVAVILVRHLSNFTDFNLLEQDPRVNLYYTNNVDEIAKADILLLPGSKSTIADLYELRHNGVADAILQAHRDGKTVWGICGGYQMMGQAINDPDGVEGDTRYLPGLGLLPVVTTLAKVKTTRQVRFHFLDEPDESVGYEIHMGRTAARRDASVRPVAMLSDGAADGCFVSPRCLGTYLHGLLDNYQIIDYLLAPYASQRQGERIDYTTFKAQQYDRLAEHVRRYVDMSKIYEILKCND